MIRPRLSCTIAVLLLLAPAAAVAQGPSREPPTAVFMGTWVFAMTNPQGSEQTVRVWTEAGSAVRATLQIGKFPPNDVTGILRDRDVLVLTTTLRENGAPIWAVIALTPDGETMRMAQMLEKSETIKRGTGRRIAD